MFHPYLSGSKYDSIFKTYHPENNTLREPFLGGESVAKLSLSGGKTGTITVGGAGNTNAEQTKHQVSLNTGTCQDSSGSININIKEPTITTKPILTPTPSSHPEDSHTPSKSNPKLSKCYHFDRYGGYACQDGYLPKFPLSELNKEWACGNSCKGGNVVNDNCECACIEEDLCAYNDPHHVPNSYNGRFCDEDCRDLRLPIGDNRFTRIMPGTKQLINPVCREDITDENIVCDCFFNSKDPHTSAAIHRNLLAIKEANPKLPSWQQLNMAMTAADHGTYGEPCIIAGTEETNGLWTRPINAKPNYKGVLQQKGNGSCCHATHRLSKDTEKEEEIPKDSIVSCEWAGPDPFLHQESWMEGKRDCFIRSNSDNTTLLADNTGGTNPDNVPNLNYRMGNYCKFNKLGGVSCNVQGKGGGKLNGVSCNKDNNFCTQDPFDNQIVSR